MKAFKVLLIIQIIGILVYTGIVGYHHGWDLFTIFFNDLAAMTWPGQFNYDFMNFLILSGLWVAWRNRFSVFGIVLGVIASVFGIMFLATYLLILVSKYDGDMNKVFMGEWA